LVVSFLFHTSSCSSTAGLNSAATTNSNIRPEAENQSAGNASDQSSKTVEVSPSPEPKDVVLFGGKNYIKKSGWKLPSRNETYVDDTQVKDAVKCITEKGKPVNITKILYVYKTPWLYSEDFHYERRNLDIIKGKLQAGYFLEMSVNGRVFMYSISGEKIVEPPASNTDPHEDPFVYQIQDTDGDGIFETLLGDYDEIIVPNWVLK